MKLIYTINNNKCKLSMDSTDGRQKLNNYITKFICVSQFVRRANILFVYKTIRKTKAITSIIFVLRVIPLAFQIFVSPPSKPKSDNVG